MNSQRGAVPLVLLVGCVLRAVPRYAREQPMSSPMSDFSAAPTISAQGLLVRGSGFLPNHDVTVRLIWAAEDISDYLAYSADGHGCLLCQLPESVTGMLYIAATDHRRDADGACGRLWSNTCTLVVPET